MKRSLAIITLSTVFLSTAAFAQSAAEKTGVNSTLGIAPKTEDFIKEAAMSDMLEIEAAKIAQQKGNATEKTFAGQMITDHTKTSSELKGMVSGDMKAAIPTALDEFLAEEARQAEGLQAGRLRGRVRSNAGQCPQGCNVPLRALRQGGRRSEVERLGGQDASGFAAPSSDGARHGQEPQIRQTAAFGRLFLYRRWSAYPGSVRRTKRR